MKKKKIYLNNKQLYKEIIISKEMGKLTKDAQDMFILLGKNVIKKFYYYNPDDKQDCYQQGLLMMFKFWHNFDESKSTNPFGYYTEVFKRGAAAGYNQLYKKVGDEYMFHQSLDYTDEKGNKITEI